jgi:hypothetical protein
LRAGPLRLDMASTSPTWRGDRLPQSIGAATARARLDRMADRPCKRDTWRHGCRLGPGVAVKFPNRWKWGWPGHVFDRLVGLRFVPASTLALWRLCACSSVCLWEGGRQGEDRGRPGGWGDGDYRGAATGVAKGFNPYGWRPDGGTAWPWRACQHPWVPALLTATFGVRVRNVIFCPFISH